MKENFKATSLLLAVHPLQGLLETYLIGLLILAIASRLEGVVDPFVVQAAMFFLCGACGMWAVLRIRLPKTGWFRQIIQDAGISLAISLIMLFGIRESGNFLHWDAVWRLTHWYESQIQVVLACTGIGYFFARGFVRLWLRWEKMRKTRMLWSITNAHLMVAFSIAFIFTVFLFLTTPYSNTARNIWWQTKDPLASMVTGFLVAFFPAATLIILGFLVTLCVILPPSALFSYFVSRRVTRRLEALTKTTTALRNGDYQARVEVVGEDEIAHLQSDFNAMADKLSSTLRDLGEEKNTVARILQSRRDLVANVSHELRTPVATLRAAMETLLERWDDTPPEENRQKVALMESEVQHLSALIDDLFTLSQADVDHLSLECSPTDLHPLILQVVDSISPLAWQSGRVEVTAQLPKDLPDLLVDPQRMQQVLLNLLRNGVRHTPPGGIVAVLVESIDGEVRIDVRDTGEGIDPEDLGHVFERFYRGKNASRESAGLGLALVRELVEAMGGSVSAESEPGKGSCFHLVFQVK